MRALNNQLLVLLHVLYMQNSKGLKRQTTFNAAETKVCIYSKVCTWILQPDLDSHGFTSLYDSLGSRILRICIPAVAGQSGEA